MTSILFLFIASWIKGEIGAIIGIVGLIGVFSAPMAYFSYYDKSGLMKNETKKDINNISNEIVIDNFTRLIILITFALLCFIIYTIYKSNF